MIMKVAVVALASATLLGQAGLATVQAQPSSPIGTWRYTTATHHVRANGRCHGISYGTGARRCDTLSGGPSGGRSNGN